jgi:hypothetical protein
MAENRYRLFLAMVLVLSFGGLLFADGWALEFDGTGDYVDCGNGSSINNLSTFSVSVWFKTDIIAAASIYPHIVSQRNASTLVWAFNLHGDFSGKVSGIVNMSGTDASSVANFVPNIGQWYHAVMTYNNSGAKTVGLYIDGTQCTYSYSITGTGSLLSDPSVKVAVGNRIGGGSNWDGVIDEAAIYNRILSPREIGEIYHCGIIPDSNLVGWWSFEEGQGQVAYDDSGLGNDGYLGSDPCGADSSDPVWVESQVQSATYYVNAADGNDTDDGMSWETAFATIQRGIDEANNCDTVLVGPGVYNESLFFLDKGIMVKSAGLAAEIVAPDTYAVSFYTAEGPNTLLSNFVIRDSDTGILVSSGAPRLEYLTIVDCNFGIEAQAGAEPNISNCILWNNKLGDFYGCQAQYSWSQQEIQSNLVSYWKFDEGSGTQAMDSAGSNHGSISGATWTGGKVGGALNFDGSNDYVDCGDIAAVDGTRGLTIMAWINTDSISAQKLVSRKGEDYPPYYFWVRSDYTIFFGIYRSYTAYTAQTTETIIPNEWFFVAGTYDGETVRTYIDGVERATNTSPSGPTNSNGFSVQIGSAYPEYPTAWFDGKIDEVVIYNRAVSADEIMRFYENGLSGRDYIDPLFADPNNNDFHLLSERGRYWPAHDVWVLDTVTSPCVDGGDPAVEPSGERQPNGGRVNMGAYGNTAYASMSEWPIEGDSNRDGVFDLKDFAIIASQWLDTLPWAL